MTFLTEQQWNNVGIRHHHGITLPLASLHSASSAGCGDFFTLVDLMPLLSSVGFDTLQLLPLNDSGFDSSPYMAMSGYALHPLYLSLPKLANFFSSPTRKTLWMKLQAETDPLQPRFNFQSAFQKKWAILSLYLSEYQTEIENNPTFLSFCNENAEWLEPYTDYKALKELHNNKAWWQWTPAFRHYPCCLPKELSTTKTRWKVVQYLCFQQLSLVKKEADKNKISLKGDLPILQSKDSADVWAHRNLFDTSMEVGAPPDMYTKEGQKWGFPLYNWQKHRLPVLTWWKKRLTIAEQFYHIYRLDHIVGFYRLFAIPPKKKPKEGSFTPSEPEQWIQQGENILQDLVPSTSMLPIGEDLGAIPDTVRHSLLDLGIPGTKVMRWERYWKEKNQPFIPLSQYSPESVSMVSTHDSSTMQGWSQEQPFDFHAALQAWGIATPKPIGRNTFRDVIKASHKTSSLFHINLFPEYLALFPHLCWPDERSNRINIPGTVSPWNWTLRLKPSVEQLLEEKELHVLLKMCSQ